MSRLPAISRALVWLRRDLRWHDHAALHLALTHSQAVYLAFVFDTDILAPLPRRDRRVSFIRDSLARLDATLAERGRAHGHAGVRLIVRHGRPREHIPALAEALGVQAVFASHDDEPSAQARDATVRQRLGARQVAWHTVKDHLVFERAELLTRAGTPYTVYTPYARAWRAQLAPEDWAERATDPHAAALAAPPPELLYPGPTGMPTLAELGFQPPADGPQAALPEPGEAGAQAALQDFLRRHLERYHATRDTPCLDSTSRLGVHLRFGTVSVRALLRQALARLPGAAAAADQAASGPATWLSELIWRDFFAQVMAHFPHAIGGAFRPEYDAIAWEQGAQAEAHLAAWREGRTGYPLVDAALRQLASSGFMHNRLRMVAASFLVKDLGIDWRRGEAHFAERLDDFDLSANNGNWQWAASTGCDAQPWFRIFNPVLQSRKFDPDGHFIRHWLPELAHLPSAALHDLRLLSPLERATLPAGYPAEPIVAHDAARERTLARYGAVRRPGA